MTMAGLDLTEPMAPTEADASLARESVRRLAPNLAKGNGAMTLSIGEPEGAMETVALPASAFRQLMTILAEMASGNAVRVIPHHAELTTQEAAELLSISRPYLVRLLDGGRLPFRRVGSHRRILFKDVMAYKAEHHANRCKALDALSKLDQELGLD